MPKLCWTLADFHEVNGCGIMRKGEICDHCGKTDPYWDKKEG